MRKCNLGGKEQFVNYSFEVNGHGSPMNYGLLRQFCELPNQPSIAHNFLGNNSNVNDFKPNVSNQGQQGTNSLLMFFDQSKFQFNSTNFNPISNLVFQILISKTKKKIQYQYQNIRLAQDVLTKQMQNVNQYNHTKYKMVGLFQSRDQANCFYVLKNLFLQHSYEQRHKHSHAVIRL